MLPCDDDSVAIDDAKNELPEVVADQEPPDPILTLEPTPCMSFHALNGFLVPSILKIAGHIYGNEVMVLIDSGSTNNFI